jgi:hypothetical protein
MPVGSQPLRPHDRTRRGVTSGASGTGVDLVCTTPGIHVSYVVDGGIWVRSTLNNWQTAYANSLWLIAAPDTIPTLAVDRRDNLWCFWHTGDTAPFNVIGRISNDYGNSWSPAGAASAISSYKFPRAVCQLDAQFFAAHNGDSVVVWRSVDYFATFDPVDPVLTISCPLQLVALRTDRRDTLHILYVDGTGTMKQRLSKDGFTWRSAVSVEASSSKPAAAFPLPSGHILLWQSGSLLRQPTLSEYELPDGAPLSTGITAFTEHYVGVDRDRRDNVWLAGQIAGATLWVGYSDTYGEPWNEVV